MITWLLLISYINSFLNLKIGSDSLISCMGVFFIAIFCLSSYVFDGLS
jgi:hypothetical protein